MIINDSKYCIQQNLLKKLALWFISGHICFICDILQSDRYVNKIWNRYIKIFESFNEETKTFTYHFGVVSNVNWWYETVNWNFAARLLTRCNLFHTDPMTNNSIKNKENHVKTFRVLINLKINYKIITRKWLQQW